MPAMKQETIDVVLATYNGASYVKEQIESILIQNYGPFRLTISDDGSTDGTRAIIEEYARTHPSVVRVLPYGKNLGVRGNFSRLLEQVTGDYVFTSDQDDVWDIDKIARSMEKMKELEHLHGKETPLLVHSDLRVVDQQLKLVSPSFWKYICIDPIAGKTLNRLLMQNVVTGCATLINQPLLKLAAPIPDNCIMHDWWMALVAAAFGKAEPLPVATIAYRQHGHNTLGATKYNSWTNIRKSIRKLGDGGASKRLQAREFLKRFDSRLNESQKAMIQAFLSLPEKSFFGKIRVVTSFGFYKHGLLRNLETVFNLRKPKERER